MKKNFKGNYPECIRKSNLGQWKAYFELLDKHHIHTTVPKYSKAKSAKWKPKTNKPWYFLNDYFIFGIIRILREKFKKERKRKKSPDNLCRFFFLFFFFLFSSIRPSKWKAIFGGKISVLGFAGGRKFFFSPHIAKITISFIMLTAHTLRIAPFHVIFSNVELSRKVGKNQENTGFLGTKEDLTQS